MAFWSGMAYTRGDSTPPRRGYHRKRHRGALYNNANKTPVKSLPSDIYLWRTVTGSRKYINSYKGVGRRSWYSGSKITPSDVTAYRPGPKS